MMQINASLKKEKIKGNSLILSWGLYDLANQFFALNIVSFYLVRWVTIEKQAPEFFYSISFGCSIFLVACLAPFLGTISDLMHRHRFFLVMFTLLSVIFTVSLGLTENLFLVLIFFAIANFGCQAAVIFYNALLINIAPQDKIGFVSGIGRMFGYFGAGLGLIIVRPLVLEGGYRAAFIPTGLLFLIFALPCMLFVKDKKSAQNLKLSSFVKENRPLVTIKQLLRDNLQLLKFAGLSNFLKAAFFYLCVVNIIMLFMSVYVTRVFGLSESQVTDLFLFSILFAIAGSLFSGYISDRIGHKRILTIVLILWVICLLSGALVRNTLYYWFIGPLVGIALSSTWVVSRALIIHIVPADKIGQVFGLFSLMGYLSAVIGAFFWGGLIWFLSPLGELGYRIAMLSLVFFLLPGLFYLRRIELIPERYTDERR